MVSASGADRGMRVERVNMRAGLERGRTQWTWKGADMG